MDPLSQRLHSALSGLVSPEIYRSWFAEIRLSEALAGGLEIHAPTRFLAEYINSHYQHILSAAAVEADMEIISINAQVIHAQA